MKYITTTFAALLACISLSAAQIDIVPAPVKVEQKSGTVNLKDVKIVRQNDRKLAPEAYVLDVTKNKIRIKSSSEAGYFYAMQTIKQMLPVEGEQILPCAHIEDYPAFAYRGLHLDCSRHFFSVDEVKKYIDIMAMYKMNYFHWHLTDDQGWRIESKLYPRLTEVGAWRKGTQIGYDRDSCDNIPHGGFYTQEEVKQIIAYAAERCITIVPEVDLPGHMLAALAAYPELGCTSGPYEMWTCWGITPQVLNPANPKTMEFLKGICGELADLFPGEYFHIGGDECPKTEWEKNEQCQELIKKLGYVTDKEATKEQRLQNWVTAQMQEFLATKGKKVIGWDEILEGDLKPGAIVMSWRGANRGILAAQKGFDVIMTPSQYLYLDYAQSYRLDKEPLGITTKVDRVLPWEKTYSFDPYDQLNDEQKKHIIGVQANLWTEYIGTNEHLEYMLIPRIFALSELQWSPVSTRDEARLRKSIEQHQFKLMDKLGYNYRKLDSVYPTPAPAGDKVMRLLYWNIQNGMWADQGNNYDNFVSWVKSYNPDVCVWCEAASIWKTDSHDKMEQAEKYLPGGWKELAARYGHQYVFIACHRDNYPQVITSRYPIEEIAHIGGAEPDSVVTHGAGWAKIRFQGEEINIVPLHTWPQKFAYGVARDQRQESAARFDGDRYREMEVKYICEHTILSQPGSENQNWIMLGDFNSRNRKDIAVYRMKDDGHTFLCQDWIAEHTPYIDVIGAREGYNFVPSTYGRARIDYIYITKPLMDRVKEAYFMVDEFTIPKTTQFKDFYNPSDHRPACLEIQFPGLSL